MSLSFDADKSAGDPEDLKQVRGRKPAGLR